MVNNYWKYKEAKTQEISSLMGQKRYHTSRFDT